MKIKPGLTASLWMLPGAIFMLLLVLVVGHFHNEQKPDAQLAFKAQRIDLVSRLQVGLLTASEAEKSAVLAITDKESKIFADQSRAATLEVERERRELEKLLKKGGTQGERDLLAQFSQDFLDVQRIDNNLLNLAIRNTNLKAYRLAFGPAAEVITDMNSSLSRLVAANSKSPEAKKVMFLAFGAQISVLHIQTFLPPHIAEESDKKMNFLEVLIAKEDEQIRADLKGLGLLPSLNRKDDLAKAISCYDRLNKIKTQILALSRENTNVRSLTISLNQKRKVMVLCQDALLALKQAILAEPIAGITYGAPAHPR